MTEKNLDLIQVQSKPYEFQPRLKLFWCEPSKAPSAKPMVFVFYKTHNPASSACGVINCSYVFIFYDNRLIDSFL